MAGAGLGGGQQVGRALTHVRAALPPGAARLGLLLSAGRLRGDGRQRPDRLVVEDAGPLAEADHRKARVVGPLVDGQHVFHAGHKGRVHRPQAPVLLAVGLRFVFLSTWPTVSWEIESTILVAKLKEKRGLRLPHGLDLA